MPFFGVEPLVIIEEDSNKSRKIFSTSDEGCNFLKKDKTSFLLKELRNAIEGELGILLLKGGFPGISKGILNSRETYLTSYFKKFEGFYHTGDEAFIKEENVYIRGRTDDILNIGGHKLSTAELESVIGSHSDIIESAVVGIYDEITGQSIHIFAVCDKMIEYELQLLLENKIGLMFRPKRIYFVKNLPKTRTGKIMRRILRAIVNNEDLGDISACANKESILEIQILFS